MCFYGISVFVNVYVIESCAFSFERKLFSFCLVGLSYSGLFPFIFTSFYCCFFLVIVLSACLYSNQSVGLSGSEGGDDLGGDGEDILCEKINFL